MMNKQTQFDSLIIKDLEESVFHLPEHGHTFYELIYIYKGSGIHIINNKHLPYAAGDLFFICPDDHHHYDIKENTRFVLIKFTDSYFGGHGAAGSESNFFIRPEPMMHRQSLKEVKLPITGTYQTLLRNMIDTVLVYHKSEKEVSSSPLVYYQVLSIFGLVVEQLRHSGETINYAEPKKENLLNYIHEQIYYPDRCRVEVIANSFNISKQYFSAYFRKNFGVSYRVYLNGYRVQLIENRLKSGNMNLKQIASEFGFTDESHLSNYFKNQKSVSPGNFRHQHQTNG